MIPQVMSPLRWASCHHLQKDMVRSAGDVLRNVDEAAEQLVDARPPGRFEGRYITRINLSSSVGKTHLRSWSLQ